MFIKQSLKKTRCAVNSFFFGGGGVQFSISDALQELAALKAAATGCVRPRNQTQGTEGQADEMRCASGARIEMSPPQKKGGRRGGPMSFNELRIQIVVNRRHGRRGSTTPTQDPRRCDALPR